jgi:hypothetical protein
MPALLLDDNHRSTPIYQPTRTDTPETTNYAPLPTGPKSDAEQAPTPKQATAKDDRSHDNFFILLFVPHNIGLALLFLTRHLIRDTIFVLVFSVI